MRKQYNGLYALVVAELKADPLSGDLFLFSNRRRTRAKVLLWDGTGLCLYQKRLEYGRFASLWQRDEQEVCELTPSERSQVQQRWVSWRNGVRTDKAKGNQVSDLHNPGFPTNGFQLEYH